MKNKRALSLIAYFVPSLFIVCAPHGFASDNTGTSEPVRIEVNRAALQELLDERCEIESEHRLAQENPDKQTKDDFVYLCKNRWEVRLQGKD